MIQYIKKAVSNVIPQTNTELFSAIVCFIVCDINSGICEEYNLVNYAKNIKTLLLTYSKEKNIELSEFTPLDYAEFYDTIGNSILFLRTYQDNFGPIE